MIFGGQRILRVGLRSATGLGGDAASGWSWPNGADGDVHTAMTRRLRGPQLMRVGRRVGEMEEGRRGRGNQLQVALRLGDDLAVRDHDTRAMFGVLRPG